MPENHLNLKFLIVLKINPVVYLGRVVGKGAQIPIPENHGVVKILNTKLFPKNF